MNQQKQDPDFTLVTTPQAVPVAPDQVVNEAKQAFSAQGAAAPQTPLEQMKQALTKVQNTIRQEQMSTEKSLQSTLAQATTYVNGSQTVEQIAQLISQILALGQQPTDIQANAPQISQLVDQLMTQLVDHHTSLDKQVSQALQQAVSSLSQAQSAMFQSQSFAEAKQLLSEFKKTLQNLQTPTQVIQ